MEISVSDLNQLENLNRLSKPLESVTLTTHPDDLFDAVSNARSIIAAAKDLVKDLESEFQNQMLQIIDERGPVQLGTEKYCRGVKKSPKQAEAIHILKDLLKATDGDVGHIAGCISSAGFKKGQVEKILGDNCKHFWSVETDTLKKSVLKKYNVAFLNEGKK